jgi:selenocysteine-specific elongation factor
MKHIVMGTAGHIDHGKTAMIKALTGINTDRLKEEKERGISIDLGFADFRLKDGTGIGVVDVPGHEKFVKNMLAGVGGIDFVLFVVAADEGVMPQTVEHLDVLHFLNIKKGILVLTKIKMVEEEWIDLVEEDLKNHVRGTFLENCPIVRIDSIEGYGIETLRSAIEDLVATIESRSFLGSFHYPVDRIFTIQGFGTVVTGTVWSGKITVGDTVEILPLGKKTRIRNIQVHKHQVEEAFAGQRVALALHNVQKSELTRGNVLSTPDTIEPSYMLDVRLIMSRNAPKRMRNRARIRFYLGTSEIFGRVILLDTEHLEPGRSGLAQLRLENPVVARKNDPFVIRSYSPVRTIGGGVIIDSNPEKHRRFRTEVIERMQVAEKGDPREIVESLVIDAQGRGITASDISRTVQYEKEEVNSILDILEKEGRILHVDEQRYIHLNVYSGLREDIEGILREYHRRNPRKVGISKEELKSRLTTHRDIAVFDPVLGMLSNEGMIQMSRARVALREFYLKLSPAEGQLKDDIERCYRESSFAPPTLAELKENHFPAVKGDLLNDLIFLLIETEDLIRISTALLYHRENLAQAERLIVSEIERQGEVSVGRCKELLGVSRKYIIPLLEYFDQKGLTRRKGDVRLLM